MATATFMSAGTDETQDGTLYGAALPAGVTSDTGLFLDGGRSLKCVNTGSGAGIFTGDGVALPAGTCMSAWFNLSTNAPSAITMLMSVETSGNGSLVLGLGINTNGTLHFGGRGTVQTDGTTVLPANTWVRLSWSYVLTSTSSWSCNIYINGVLELTLTQTLGTLGFANPTCATFGIGNSSQNGFSSPAAMTVYVDSMYIDNRTDLSDCGAVHVTAKRPVANGTTNNFAKTGTGSGYGTGNAVAVNERPFSAASFVSITPTTVKTEEYTIEGKAVGDVDLTFAKIIDFLGWISAEVASVSNTPVMKIIVAGVSTTKTLALTAAAYYQGAGSTTYPAGNTDIGMSAQYTTTGHLVTLNECGILVAFIPAPIGKDIFNGNNNLGLNMGQAVNRASTY